MWDVRWRISDFGLRIAECGLQMADVGLRLPDCVSRQGLRLPECVSRQGFRIADFGLRIADGLMLFYTKLSSSISDMVGSFYISHSLAR